MTEDRKLWNGWTSGGKPPSTQQGLLLPHACVVLFPIEPRYVKKLGVQTIRQGHSFFQWRFNGCLSCVCQALECGQLSKAMGSHNVLRGWVTLRKIHLVLTGVRGSKLTQRRKSPPGAGPGRKGHPWFTHPNSQGLPLPILTLTGCRCVPANPQRPGHPLMVSLYCPSLQAILVTIFQNTLQKDMAFSPYKVRTVTRCDGD